MIKTRLLFVSFLFITCFVVYDFILDSQLDNSLQHIVFEASIATASFSWLVYFCVAYVKMFKEKNRYQEESSFFKSQTQQIREGLALAIDKQFKTWDLTEAEQEIAFLLIKGFSTKEIAEFRNGSERTVRHHAQSIYAKSKISGRAELAAYFLEDILPTHSLVSIDK